MKVIYSKLSVNLRNKIIPSSKYFSILEKSKDSQKSVNFIKKDQNISDYYTVFNKLAEKNNLSNDNILESGLNVKVPKIIANPNKSKKYFQDLQNKGLFLRMKGGQDDFFNTSAKKIKVILAKIRGKYIYDALDIMKNDHTKASKKLQERLKKFFQQNQGILDENKKYVLKIKVATVGNKNALQRVNFRAKGRTNFWQRKQSMVNIGFDKVPFEKLAEEIASGNTPLFVRNKLKQNIFKSNTNYSDVKLLRFMLSSSGVRERRIMINSSIRRIVGAYKASAKKKINNKIIRESIIKSLTPSCFNLFKKYYFMDHFKNKIIIDKNMEIPYYIKLKERKEKLENYI